MTPIHQSLIIPELHGNQPGDARKLANLLVDIVKQEGIAKDKPLPAALPIGPDCVQTVRTVCKEMEEVMDLWYEGIVSTDISSSA